MKTINLITSQGVKKILYPDGQPHVIVEDIKVDDEVRVIAPIRSSLELVQLLMVANAIKNRGAFCSILVIPYLMAARSDRIMQKGDSFDLEVVADLINSCGFLVVNIFDPHSRVALTKIRRSTAINNRHLVERYDKAEAVLIVPDAGAAEKAQEYLAWNPKLVDVAICEKSRDLTNGRVTLSVKHPERCLGRNCVVIDDICDGGATFLAIAEQIHQPAHLTLIVSHGIFSKGFSRLRDKFQAIITTDSFEHPSDHCLLTVPLNL